MNPWLIILILASVTALLNYYRLKLEDKGEKPKLQNILIWITLIMGFFSLPVIIVFLGLDTLYSNRLIDRYEKKILSLEEQIIDLKAKIRERGYNGANREEL